MSNRRHDFESKLYILSHEEGGCINPVGQGYVLTSVTWMIQSDNPG